MKRIRVLRKIRYILVLDDENDNPIRESKYLFTKLELRRIARLLKYWKRNE